jgi:hypothetical protein
MSRNKMAGKGKSSNNEKTGRDYSKEKAYQSSPERTEYRNKLNKANRKMKSKVGDGKDASHTKDGSIVKESQKTNRARNGHGKGGRTLK